METDALELAISRIVEVLKHPDDLNSKCSILRKRHISEKASIEAQLKAGVQYQVDDLTNSLEALTTSKKELSTIKQHMLKANTLCHTAHNMMSNFPHIEKLFRTHKNFISAKFIVDRFQELTNDLDNLKRLLRKEKREKSGDPAILYFIHYRLFRLEEFRDFTVYQTRSASLDVNRTVEMCFHRLSQFSQEFAEYLWELAKSILELIQKSQYSIIVAIVKIIEKEEKADEMALSTSYEVSVDGDSGTSSQAKESKKEEAKHPREIKSYRSKFFQVLHDLVDQRFSEKMEAFGSNRMEMLNGAKFVFEDLTLICDKLSPRVPKKYKIFPFFALGYHRIVYDMIQKVTQLPLDVALILAIFQWVRDYHSRMQQELGISEELLEPRLLDVNQSNLVEEYLRLIKSKLLEWQQNLMNTEVKEFLERSNSPDVDGAGLYGLSASVLLFQMLNQQLDVAVDSQNELILLGVVRECKVAIDGFQQQWIKQLDIEFKKQFEQPDRTAPGLVEYTMALANDNLKALEFTESLIDRLQNIVPETSWQEMKGMFSQSMDAFMDVAKRCFQYLIDVAFNDLKSAFATLFTDDWYKMGMVPSIILTLQDYCEDYNAHLNQYLFTKMISDIMDRFILTYLEAMRAKGVKLRIPEFGDKMLADIESALDFFAAFKSRKRIEGKFQAMEYVRLFITSSPNFAFMDFYTLWKAFPDVPLTFIEDIVYRRTDLDKATCKEIMETIKNKSQEQSATKNASGEHTKSLFSKMK